MSEDSDLQSSLEEVKTRVETQLECGEIEADDVKSLLTEIEILKVQNENMKARLLEASVSTGRHLQEINKLKAHLEQLTEPPLFIATILEVNGDIVLIRQHGNNQEVLTQIPEEYRGKIDPGMRVAVNGAYSIISIVSRAADVRAQVMELINSPGVDYSMIGGLDDVLQEVRESVELPLTEPELFEDLGIEPPSGVLLHGAPGTGKTLVAKAIASQAKATFIRMSGSDLVQKFVGEGSRLVKDIFQLARDKSPSILFIDEIDAVGSMRTYDGTSGSAEVNRTMLQLLAEMDGFDPKGNVKVVAATNRIDLLDPALLRPGRFDRSIEIPIPDEKGRVEILKIHTRKMNLADDVNFEKLAKVTTGMSGAELSVITKEAGIFVLRRRGKQITMADFMKAYDKVVNVQETSIPQAMFV
ncbi:Proteasome-activating AAA-ATPase (PAN), archaeal [Methanosarcina sp. MTP4]|uniref:proteasome-activating nucleotidase n=1 Tax=Methanosarcina sp. MTP4 TaxID=1434100 RepID=UPI000616135D|nr:proteasome-activating nucleotidase [Methanosarcina sp. MTP4]AKB24019.1 Proteasome-activating AAA-ATPase (PAN), archaeal [Methanosarcina sp. MTP4]